MKHCFMILAHNEPEMLGKLCHQIDKEGNTIIIHIDKKSKCDFAIIKDIVKSARLKFIDKPIKVYWGHNSQMMAEYKLFEESIHYDWDYCHLISGQHLLIKPYTEFDSFFEEHKGQEFFEIDDNAMANKKFLWRIKYYHFFGKYPYSLLKRVEDKFSYRIQEKLHIDRNKKSGLTFAKGANWFSATRDFMSYGLTKEKANKRRYKHTSCVDEVFLHTDLYNSPFYQNNYGDLLYTDWSKNDCSPETLDMSYLDTLKSSPKLFARKFSYTKCPDIVDEVIRLTDSECY